MKMDTGCYKVGKDEFFMHSLVGSLFKTDTKKKEKAKKKLFLFLQRNELQYSFGT